MLISTCEQRVCLTNTKLDPNFIVGHWAQLLTTNWPEGHTVPVDHENQSIGSDIRAGETQLLRIAGSDEERICLRFKWVFGPCRAAEAAIMKRSSANHPEKVARIPKTKARY